MAKKPITLNPNAAAAWNAAAAQFAASTPAPGGGFTPPPAPPPGIPFNATAQAEQAAAQHSFDISDLGPGGFQYQLGQLDFNYNSPLNPFNQARMMARAYHQAVSRNTNSYAARGQLYAGSLQNAQNDANFGYQRSSAAAQQAYQNAKNRILQMRAQGQQGVKNTTALSNAQVVDASAANPGG